MMKYCCQKMQEEVNRTCDIHQNQFDCPDAVIYYSKKFDEYGIIIHDGGTSFYTILFCPWCGQKLPDSKRDRWFEEIEKLGLESDSDNLPEDFQSDKWYRNS